MHISAIWLAIILLIVSVLYAFLKEKSVNSTVIALWAIAVAIILNSGISIG